MYDMTDTEKMISAMLAEMIEKLDDVLFEQGDLFIGDNNETD